MKSQTDKLTGLWRAAKSAGWWIPHRNICWVSERHSILRRDERGRLHADGGPACAYPDGWAIYAWHGVRVPEKVITAPESLDPAKVIAEPNAEIRRVMIDRVGMDRILRELKAKMLHRDRTGRLYRLKIPGDEAVVAVRVKDPSTDREYWLRVPPQITRARDAVAWTFALPSKEYKPGVES